MTIGGSDIARIFLYSPENILRIFSKGEHEHTELKEFDLPDEICTTIMEFLDWKFAMSVCRLISKQWLEAHTHLKVAVSILDGLSRKVDNNMVKISGTTETRSAALHKIITASFTNTWISLEWNKNAGHKDISILTNTPRMSNLTNLRIDRIDLDNIRLITDSPYMTNLTSLVFGSVSVSHGSYDCIAKSKSLLNLTHLDLGSRILETELSMIAESTLLPKLTSLDMRGPMSTATGHASSTGGFASLTSNEVEGGFRLTKLVLNNINYSNFVVELVSGNTMRNLAYLNVQNNDIGDDGFVLIAKSLNMPNLIDLCVSNNSITHIGIKSISASLCILKLTSLKISSNNIGDEGSGYITVSPLVNLTRLNLNSCGITGKGLSMLLQSSNLVNLKDLSFSYNNAVGLSMSDDKYSPKLTSLYLSGSKVDDAVLDLISKNVNMRNLKKFMLYGNNITAIGAISIASSEYMSNLTRLSLFHNNASDQGIKAIVSSPFMTNLTSLDVAYTDISNVGAIEIANSRYMRELRKLNVNHNNIRGEGITAINESKYLSKSIVINMDKNDSGGGTSAQNNTGLINSMNEENFTNSTYITITP